MNPHLSAALAQTRVADMHKAAASFTKTETPTDDDSVAHERQRTLVLASLLLSRRADPPTHRRSA
jgi:hypothetical protein